MATLQLILFLLRGNLFNGSKGGQNLFGATKCGTQTARELTLMQRHSEKGKVAMIRRYEIRVKMAAHNPGLSVLAATTNKKSILNSLLTVLQYFIGIIKGLPTLFLFNIVCRLYFLLCTESGSLSYTFVILIFFFRTI